MINNLSSVFENLINIYFPKNNSIYQSKAVSFHLQIIKLKSFHLLDERPFVFFIMCFHITGEKPVDIVLFFLIRSSVSIYSDC